MSYLVSGKKALILLPVSSGTHIINNWAEGPRRQYVVSLVQVCPGDIFSETSK